MQLSSDFTYQELKDFLDYKTVQYTTKDFIEVDPIQLPHRFSKKEDIEIVSFLVSTIAWGDRKSIISSGEKMLEIMEHQPYEFIQNYEPQSFQFVHRTFNQEDLNAFFLSLKRCYLTGGLENAFRPDPIIPGVLGRINQFRTAFTAGEFPNRTQKHISNPIKGSSAKRLNMFLRWMVRPNSGGVDFGIWHSIQTSELHLPLDVHTGNVARKLGILTRKQNDWRAVEEIQSFLIQLDPNDPCKYDFALFGLGAFEQF